MELAQTQVHRVGDAIQSSHSLSPPSLALNLSSIRVFSSEWTLHIRWPQYWSFSFSISPSSDYSGLISFRMDWFDLSTAAATAAKSLRLCPTLCDPTDGSPRGSPAPGILQARILEWVAISFSRQPPQPRDQTRDSCLAGGFFTTELPTTAQLLCTPIPHHPVLSVQKVKTRDKV